MMCPEPDREMIPLSLFFYRSTEASEMICPELVIQDFDSMTTPAQRAAVVKKEVKGGFMEAGVDESL